MIQSSRSGISILKFKPVFESWPDGVLPVSEGGRCARIAIADFSLATSRCKRSAKPSLKYAPSLPLSKNTANFNWKQTNLIYFCFFFADSGHGRLSVSSWESQVFVGVVRSESCACCAHSPMRGAFERWVQLPNKGLSGAAIVGDVDAAPGD